MNGEVRVLLWVVVIYLVAAMLMGQIIAAAPTPLDAASQRVLGGGIEYALGIFVVAITVIGKASLAAWRFHIGRSRILRAYEALVFPILVVGVFVSFLPIAWTDIEISAWLVFVVAVWVISAGGVLSDSGLALAGLRFWRGELGFTLVDGEVVRSSRDFAARRAKVVAIFLHIALGVFFAALLTLKS